MQRLAAGVLVEAAPRGSELWLDGGHNADGGRVAAAALGDLEERVSRPLVVIVGMMANKDAAAFLANFAGLTRHIIAVPIASRADAMPPERLADAARKLGMRVEIAASVEAALHSVARLLYEVPPRILIAGSLYLAGQVLAVNGTPPGVTSANGRRKPAVHSIQSRRCDQTAALIHCCSLAFGAAPTWREAISPPLKIISVGIDITPYFDAVFGFSSTLSLTILTLSPIAPAISSSAGAIIRHGPHHSAQKSTTTGPVAFSTSEFEIGV